MVTFSHCRSRSFLKKWFSKKNKYDANIFLERIFPSWFGAAKKNILIPNQERFPKRHIGRLKHIDHVFCKSQHAQEIFSKLGASTQYLGFTSKDVFLKDTKPNYDLFFHLAGSSTLKGTDTILKLWKKHPEWPMLTILQHEHNAPDTVPSNVTLITKHLPYDELTRLANETGIHLCTSLSEGWGHYIVEAMSCEALVITTDAPPMNELISSDRGVTIPYKHSEPRHLGTNFFIDEDELMTKIEEVISMSQEDKSALGKNARDWYLENNTRFTNNLIKSIETIL
jgi:glycosyltransferase involved in cell wall biosynthesis